MSFGAPEWLWGLLLIPLLIALFVRAERRGHRRLQEFVSARLLPQLAATVNRPRRITRFGFQLLGLALALVSLAQPRWGYTFEDVKRKGLDLLIAVDTSRSMLSNDVQPNRLDRVKLAVQDLINELQGDRVGLIAFAGRAFLQAPLTIDYDAVVEAINDLDTKTIPEGGTNISSAITLATQSFGKSATGNRALIIFTDGEELSGDAVKTAKEAADAGVRIFTVGVGTPQGSLIPVTGDDGQTAFVKDSAGQVVKSKLDDKRLREIAEATGGFYVHLESGLRTMQQVQNEGLAKMQAAEMDVRLSRRPIERYEWPLSAALLALALSILIPERKRARERRYVPAAVRTAGATAALLILLTSFSFATAPGIDAYHEGKFEDAYSQFQQTLKSHPESRAEDKLQFDSGAAAYKLKDYNKALESFSQALLTRDTGLQSRGHYNLGNTLYQRGETEKSDEKKLSDWTNALNHYEQTLKLDPQNREAKDNYDYVKKKIEELKNKKSQQQPSPSPSPSPQQKNKQNQQNKQDQQQQQQQQNQDQQQQKQSQQNQQQQQDQQQQNQQQQQQQGQGQQEKKDQQQQSQNQQSQNQSPSDKEQKQEKQNDQSQAKNEPQKQQQQQPGESPSPSPGAEKQQANQPSPSPGERKAEESPTPGEGENEMPSPSPGEGEDENATPSASPAESPQKKFAGEVKGAAEDKFQKPPDKNAQMAEAESEKEGQMSERQALALLESMKDEEARVQLDERKVRRRVYNDW
ncbi:MAG TPA: VWA domain-containing protein [Candidatus Limnocylindria bacterium]|nr:VWA domain-containing protein [Candidatus Limnocylindria bacterium]